MIASKAGGDLGGSLMPNKEKTEYKIAERSEDMFDFPGGGVSRVQF